LEGLVSSNQSKAGIRSRLLGAGLIALLAVAGSACSSSSKSTATTLPGPRETPTSTISATPQKGTPAPAAALAAINRYELKSGPALGTWLLTAVQASLADPTYVMFRISPASAKDTNVQGGYGFAHLKGGTWTVVGFGSDSVGCPPGAAGNAVVPALVISGFGFSC
jgi:Flp pilus assembly protein TadD